MDLSRNWLFIENTKELSNVKVLIAGVGMGSMIAELLLRTGFKNVTFCDGDTVELSNLNRQNYTSKDVGRLKTKSLKKRLDEIGKNNYQVENKFLKKEDLVRLIKDHDIIINTIDFDQEEFMFCSEEIKKQGKIEIFPINLGFSGTVIVLDKENNWSFKEKDNDLKNVIIQHVLKKIDKEYFWEKFKEYEKQKRGYDPQLGVSTLLNSSIVVSVIVRILDKKKVKKFPEIYFYDPYNDE